MIIDHNEVTAEINSRLDGLEAELNDTINHVEVEITSQINDQLSEQIQDHHDEIMYHIENELYFTLENNHDEVINKLENIEDKIVDLDNLKDTVDTLTQKYDQIIHCLREQGSTKNPEKELYKTIPHYKLD
jgi:MFS superfamily sulfate permease-like transporter